MTIQEASNLGGAGGPLLLFWDAIQKKGPRLPGWLGHLGLAITVTGAPDRPPGRGQAHQHQALALLRVSLSELGIGRLQGGVKGATARWVAVKGGRA